MTLKFWDFIWVIYDCQISTFALQANHRNHNLQNVYLKELLELISLTKYLTPKKIHKSMHTFSSKSLAKTTPEILGIGLSVSVKG